MNTSPATRPNDTHTIVPNLPTLFHKLIGELLYLFICARFDISFTVNSLAQHSSNSSSTHYTAAKWMLCYLSSTMNLWLHYGGANVNDGLYTYYDAD